MKMLSKILLISLIGLSLSSCSSGLFDKDNTPTPAALAEFKPEAKMHVYWIARPGYGIGKDYLKISPTITKNAIYSASYHGIVTASDKATGKLIWQTKTKTAITGGVGSGDQIIVVGGEDGSIVALDQTNGTILWTNKAASEIQAVPVIHNGTVLIKAIDGKVTAYSSKDGHERWAYQQTEPNLILRGASTPQINDHYAIIGFANGNLIKLTTHDGSLIWQKPMAIPEGSFAIQRMIDIDADPLLYDNRIYVATYQGRISALQASSGQELWTHDISSYTGLTADNNRVFITDAKSNVWAFDADSGIVDWRQPKLEARNITAPAIIGNYIVVGDAQGYLHVLDKKDGHFIARTRVNHSGIIAAPIVSDNIIYVLTKDGHLAAYGIG